MTEVRRTGRWIRVAASWLAAIALAPALAIPFIADPAAGETEEELLAKKDQWQGRYRELRNNVARMQENAKKLRKAYSKAQHANYPRGGARDPSAGGDLSCRPASYLHGPRVDRHQRADSDRRG